MKQKTFILHYSAFAWLIGMIATSGADGAIRIGNVSRNYAGAYQQVAAQQQAMDATQQTTIINTTDQTDPAAELPVRVANANMAEMIARGDANAPATVAQLEQCAKIYPDGEFAWDRPNVGPGAGGAPTCVAVVEMRAYQMGPGGSDAVLARANVAAGQTVKCNISEFPEASYTAAAGNITFPADNEPTTDDVIRVMNEEQKQNAGIKIAASAVLGAIGGNIIGKNEPGKDGLLGTGKQKIQSSVVGALGGAALGAGNAYAGKVAGDMIMSTGVNAYAGGLIGNMAGVGNSVLRIEKCKTVNDSTDSCLFGFLTQGTEIDLTSDNTTTRKNAYFNITDAKTVMVCNAQNEDCQEEDLTRIEINGRSLSYYKDTDFQAMRTNADSSMLYYLKPVADKLKPTMAQGSNDQSALYTPITRAIKPTKRIAAAVVGVHDKTFGFKSADWTKWKDEHRTLNADQLIFGRNAYNGDLYKLENIGAYTLDDFEPITVNASDGSLIDFNNKARMKSTMVGAGAGGALGAFSAYQGAQSDIDERWAAAVREYKDSLTKIYCATGRRFLSHYNDMADVPATK